MIVTKSWIVQYIKEKPAELAKAMVGRALWRLWRRQTADEQQDKRTKHRNARGFNAFDAVPGSYAGQYYAKHGTITNQMFKEWTAPRGRGGYPKICRYTRQLNEIALEVGKSKET